ncbi:YqgU-like beta propeller domain-containing protein [Halalkalibacter okhensis]|uniref:YqgU-like 6-bladed beta-propeller domain-containing protein n=1 Tax=Halalkalibacter okhensis TaxID=333138 RepID=A0A0B0IQ89_9BACI|nr:hypothetical protein [Halalkalibacter okhensis]KHF41821.1 hypothetical protein LQ50_00545 [Halalkalibacter okhensis]
MRRVILGICFLFIVSACTQTPMESQPLPKSSEYHSIKRDVSTSFFTGSDISPIPNEQNVAEILGWYDAHTVLYLQEREERSSLVKHQLATGESTNFFEVDGWITDVRPNADYSLFAISQVTLDNETLLVIVDRDGTVIQTIKDYGEEYTVYWNPYKLNTFIMIAFLPNWDFETYVVDVEEVKVRSIDLEQSYVQWISATDVGYLKWEELEPDFQAPLYEVNVDSGDVKKWKDAVIAYMSFSDGLSLSVTVESVYDLYSTYTFYDEQEPFRQIEMPILNTYSEQWWIPYYSYDEDKGIFYYLRPQYSSDFFSYTDGFELVAYDVQGDAEEKITLLERHVPISVSPEGSFLLFGDRLERVFDLAEGAIVPLIEE